MRPRCGRRALDRASHPAPHAAAPAPDPRRSPASPPPPPQAPRGRGPSRRSATATSACTTRPAPVLIRSWMQTTAQGGCAGAHRLAAQARVVLTRRPRSPPSSSPSTPAWWPTAADKLRIILRCERGVAGGGRCAGVLTQTALVTYPMAGLAFVLGTAQPARSPPPELLRGAGGQRDLPNAIALNSMQFNGSRIVGPAIAGWMIGVSGTAACFFANGCRSCS